MTATATHPIPDPQGAVFGTGHRYRVLTVEHVPFDFFPPYSDGGPATVVTTRWGVSQSSLSPLSSPSVVADDDGMITLNVYAFPRGAGPSERHALDGTKYATRADADRAAYDAGLIGFMVYTADHARLGVTFRFTRHNRPDGEGCPWSCVSVVAPEFRTNPGDRRCPSDCPDSDIEINPHGDDQRYDPTLPDPADDAS